MNKSEAEILKSYCKEKFPELDSFYNPLISMTYGFRIYLLSIRIQELKTAIFEAMPESIKKLWRKK